MVFTSLVFLCYFLPITLLGYFLLGFSLPLQNVWLLATSLVFYAWGEPVYIFLMLGSIIVNWIIGQVVCKYRDKKRKKAKAFLVIGIVVNVISLVIFKYLGFIISNINFFLGSDVIPDPGISLPIGISFYTFQAMSYVIDVYRGDADSQKNPLFMGLYIAFFPQMIAGPIVRYNTIAESIRNRKVTFDDVAIGLNRFAIGMAKKIIIANNLAVVVDMVFELVKTGRNLYETPALMAWIAAIGYMLQIYYDFSAYSDMAIGLGRVFGFKFEENFNYPNVSKSVGEFWRKWHISLGTWFKEYVYFPLGGSRVENQDLMVKNTLIVWLLTGIWHGASWTFVIWGLYNFFFIILERMFGFEKWKLPSWVKLIYSQLVFLFGWVLFRSENIYQLRECVMDMFMMNDNVFVNDTTIWLIKEYGMIYVLAIVFSAPVYPLAMKKLGEVQGVFSKALSKTGYVLILSAGVLISVIAMVRGGYNPFIYFNF